MLVSIIVPAYKQEKTIKKDIERICSVMNDTRFDYEVIVVVDGFLDNTFAEAEKIKNNEVKVIGYEKNRGKGYAVRYGMARALGDPIAFIDAGMEIDPNGISMILEQMLWRDADIIVASKRHPDSKVNYSLARRIYSWGYYSLIRLLFRLKVTDTQTGLKVYKRKVLDVVLPRLVVKQYAFDIELLAVAKYLGHNKIYDAPVNLTLDLKSGSVLNKKFFRFFRAVVYDTLAVFYRMYLLRYYHPNNQQKWVYDKELDMRINTGQIGN